jgi:hypothetical protein
MLRIKLCFYLINRGLFVEFANNGHRRPGTCLITYQQWELKYELHLYICEITLRCRLSGMVHNSLFAFSLPLLGIPNTFQNNCTQLAGFSLKNY